MIGAATKARWAVHRKMLSRPRCCNKVDMNMKTGIEMLIITLGHRDAIIILKKEQK